jgi:hypothetical protein
MMNTLSDENSPAAGELTGVHGLKIKTQLDASGKLRQINCT